MIKTWGYSNSIPLLRAIWGNHHGRS